jgi:hypothetical protein
MQQRTLADKRLTLARWSLFIAIPAPSWFVSSVPFVAFRFGVLNLPGHCEPMDRSCDKHHDGYIQQTKIAHFASTAEE